ncbi:MAG: FtsX-like permease family protein [Planctomycetaceae bacterium]
MILPDPLSDAVLAAAEELGLSAEPTLVYLANEIAAADRDSGDKRYSMYSIVAGIPFQDRQASDSYRLRDGKPVPQLRDHDLLLSAWLAADLQVDVGGTVKARWHDVGSHGELPEIERDFTVQGIFPDDDPQTVDVNLTPHVPGITDVESFSDWNQPFEMEMSRITERDDAYWAAHRATPKAFVSLATAEDLWSSRFGRYTSIRIAPVGGLSSLTEAQRESLTNRITNQIVANIDPTALGLFFRPVLAEGLTAAVGANDFTQLFIGFSFFLILSAIILAALMFRLGIQQRVSQLGLLQAVGWPSGRVRWFFLAEGLVVAASGALVGTFAAVGFARLMIHGLTTWWVGAIGTQFLLPDVRPSRLAVAAGISMLLAGFVIWTAVRAYRRVPVRELLTGTADENASPAAGGRSAWLRVMTICRWGAVLLAIGIPLAVVFGVIPQGEAFEGLTWNVVCFFVAGFACLTAGLFVLQGLLLRRASADNVSTVARGLTGLALANAARSRQRSLLTTALIAFATFVIVAVGAGRRNPLSETPDIRSGNGGFTLVAESSQPILFDVNTDDGRTKLGFGSAPNKPALPAGTRVYSFSMKPGQDASCANLYQARVPTLLGASREFISRGGFRFAKTPGENPWELLTESLPDNDGLPAIPVIGDMNTLQFSLKKAIGDVVLVPDEISPQFALQIVGMLDGSVLQGALILSTENLHRVDADVSGDRYFLVEVSKPENADKAAAALEGSLNSFGMDTEPVAQRLAGFLAVQNTYLSTFQMLGGLGLLVGTFGLAAVMMRNVIERRREIALLRAVGFTTLRVCRVILIENWLLLFWGIGLGAASALLAMLPHLLSTGADVPWEPLGITLAAVAAIGSVASVFAIRRAATVSIRENLATE